MYPFPLSLSIVNSTSSVRLLLYRLSPFILEKLIRYTRTESTIPYKKRTSTGAIIRSIGTSDINMLQPGGVMDPEEETVTVRLVLDVQGKTDERVLSLHPPRGRQISVHPDVGHYTNQFWACSKEERDEIVTLGWRMFKKNKAAIVHQRADDDAVAVSPVMSNLKGGLYLIKIHPGNRLNPTSNPVYKIGRSADTGFSRFTKYGSKRADLRFVSVPLSELKSLEAKLKLKMKTTDGISLVFGQEFFSGEESLILSTFQEFVDEIAKDVTVEELPVQKPPRPIFCMIQQDIIYV